MKGALAAIVFDLDGTLVDSRADIASATNHALSTHGLLTLPTEQVSEFVGDGARHLIARAARLPHGAAAVSELLDTFLEYYASHACCSTTLMPGAQHALDTLGDVPLAILTNKPRACTDAVLRGLDIERYFRCVIAGGDVPQLKPNPAPFVAIAERLGTRSSNLIMIGDGPQDIHCGRAAGGYTIGVLGGIAMEQALRDASPDRILESLYELPDVVHELTLACEAMIGRT